MKALKVDWVSAAYACVLIVVFVMLARMLFAFMTADTKVSRCSVRRSFSYSERYEVVGHREWREDVVLGFANTREAAERMRGNVCPP